MLEDVAAGQEKPFVYDDLRLLLWLICINVVTLRTESSKNK